MYKRIRDGLFGPKSIISYLGDKWYYPFFVILIFVLLLLVPNIIQTVNFEISYEKRSEFNIDLAGEYIPYKIINGELVCYDENFEGPYEIVIDGIKLVITDKNTNILQNLYTNSIIFSKDELFIRYSNGCIEMIDYTLINDIQNLDFDSLTNANLNKINAMANVFERIYKSSLASKILFVCFSCILGDSLIVLFFALLLSLACLFRLSKVIKFSSIFKMNIYYMAPYVFANAIALMFDVAFLGTIGLLISIIYSIIGTNTIIIKILKSRMEENRNGL